VKVDIFKRIGLSSNLNCLLTLKWIVFEEPRSLVLKDKMIGFGA
jgi:hypothetical protein